jgi:hypothetical protein
MKPTNVAPSTLAVMVIATLSSVLSQPLSAQSTPSPSAPIAYVCSLAGILTLATPLCALGAQQAQLPGMVWSAHIINGNTVDRATGNWIAAVATSGPAYNGTEYVTTVTFAAAFPSAPFCQVTSDFPPQGAGGDFSYADVSPPTTTSMTIVSSVSSDANYNQALGPANFTLTCQP